MKISGGIPLKNWEKVNVDWSSEGNIYKCNYESPIPIKTLRVEEKLI